jgi:hypothetical protein
MAEVLRGEVDRRDCLSVRRASEAGRIASFFDRSLAVLPVNCQVADSSNPPTPAIRTRPGNVIDQAPMHVAFQAEEIEIDRARRQGSSDLQRAHVRRPSGPIEVFGECLDAQPWLVERGPWQFIDPVAIRGRRLHEAGVDWAFGAVEYPSAAFPRQHRCTHRLQSARHRGEDRTTHPPHRQPIP